MERERAEEMEEYRKREMIKKHADDFNNAVERERTAFENKKKE